VKVNIPDFKFEGFGVDTEDMIKDMINKPMQLGVSSRGVAPIDDTIRFEDISWLDTLAVLPDNKGTSGWSEEVTRPVKKLGGFYPNGIESYDSRMVMAYDPASTEDYVFPNIGSGSGSRVETLPNPTAFEPIEFTLDDLEELTELINTVESQEMKF
jgi:hypothetical protein